MKRALVILLMAVGAIVLGWALGITLEFVLDGLCGGKR